MPDVFVAADADQNQPKSKADKLSKKNLRKPSDYSELMRDDGGKVHPLSAFVVRPKNLKFETQESREKVLLLMRRHPVVNVGWILVAILMVLAPLLLSIVPLLEFLPARFKLVTVVFWYLFTFGYTVEQFLNWYFNVYIITDERIIDFDFYSLIFKRVSEAKIDNVEDVTFQMGGVLSNVFNYGTVFIQTAGEAREFEFEDTPQPQKVVKFLNELALEEEREKLEGRVR